MSYSTLLEIYNLSSRKYDSASRGIVALVVERHIQPFMVKQLIHTNDEETLPRVRKRRSDSLERWHTLAVVDRPRAGDFLK